MDNEFQYDQNHETEGQGYYDPEEGRYIRPADDIRQDRLIPDPEEERKELYMQMLLQQ